MTWYRKFVLLLVLAVMPLQGITATASMFKCHTDTTDHVPHVMHAADSHDHDVDQDARHVHDDGGTGTQALGHYCFHHFASALPAVTLPPAMAGREIRAFASHTLHDLFVPDRPQRPPLA